MRQRFFILLLIGLACCKAKTDIVLPPVQLLVEVVDTNNKPLNFSVPVYLFNSLSAYNAASANDTGTGAILMDTTIKSECIFTGIPTTSTYYVYSHYKNYSGFQGGYYITYDNSDNFTIDSAALNINPAINTTPQISAKIIMKPADGLVSFWTPSNTDVLPIQVFVDNNLFGTINTTFEAQPFYTVPGVLNGLLKKGKHSYYATSNNCSGCLWEAPPIEIKGGESFTIALPACTTGTVVFWTDASNSSALPIDIIRPSDKSVIATITNITANFNLNNINSDDFPPNAKFVDNPTDTVYFKAQSRTDTNCVWEGKGDTYSISSGQCSYVKILPCGQ